VPAIITHPIDYLPEKDNLADLENNKEKFGRKRSDLIAELASIDTDNRITNASNRGKCVNVSLLYWRFAKRRGAGKDRDNAKIF